MKGRVEGMDGKTTELATSISNINDSSDVINTGLADRRTKIEELNRTRGLLKKLQFIFELPARITRCIDNDRWTEAVQCYKAALPHLDKHKEQDCFNTSRLEAIALIKDQMLLRKTVNRVTLFALYCTDCAVITVGAVNTREIYIMRQTGWSGDSSSEQRAALRAALFIGWI